MLQQQCGAHIRVSKKKLLVEKGINIETMPKITQYLTQNASDYKGVSAPILDINDVNNFLTNAPEDDMKIVLSKIALSVGIHGGLRVGEYILLLFDDIVETKKDNLIIQVKFLLPKSKTDKKGEGFTFMLVKNDNKKICPIIYYQKYISYFSDIQKTGRFFRQIRNNKATKQPLGKDFFQQYPKIVAKFLGKPNADEFTGHSIRRTGATILADKGESKPCLKRYGRWRSDCVVDKYIDESDLFKTTISAKMLGSSEPNPKKQKIFHENSKKTDEIEEIENEIDEIEEDNSDIFQSYFKKCVFNGSVQINIKK